jgi:GTP-binding protein
MRTARAIDRCDIAVVVLDAERGLEAQDKRIINDVIDARRGVIIAVNKWDAIEKETNTALEFTRKVHSELKTFDYVPVVYISAHSKQRLSKLIDMAKEVQQRRISRTPPPNYRGHDLRINYITQTKVAPPTFAFFCNHPQELPDSYKRFLERTLRKHLDLEGVPVSFLFRKKNKNEDER